MNIETGIWKRKRIRWKYIYLGRTSPGNFDWCKKYVFRTKKAGERIRLRLITSESLCSFKEEG